MVKILMIIQFNQSGFTSELPKPGEIRLYGEFNLRGYRGQSE
jgi:hypothetical protein